MCYFSSLILQICVYLQSHHSLTHWPSWPATGRCALQTPRSLAMSKAASAACPTSTSNWRIQVCRGRPRGRFHSGLTSGRWPARVLTARRSASCAGTVPCRRRTWRNIEISLFRILLQVLCCWVWLISDAFGTKSNQRNPRIRRKHDIWKDSSLYVSRVLLAWRHCVIFSSYRLLQNNLSLDSLHIRDVNKATEYKASVFKAKANVLLLLLHSAY